MIPMMKEAARQEGIQMEYGGMIGNTRNSHRLIALADDNPEKQDTIVEALFHSFFEVNDDISSVDVLSDIAVKCNVFKTKQDAKAFFASDKGASQVDEKVDEAYKMGISGVPNFTFQNKFSINGAQEPLLLERVIEKLLNDNSAGFLPPTGNTC